MPSTIIPQSNKPDSQSRQASGTFSGTVWMHPIHADGPGPTININQVMFTPGARTYWHTHEHGQFLRVMAGSGWICDKGGEPRRLNVGDSVWCDAGTTHWHGGGDGSFMMHLAVSHGRTEWLGEVTEEEYRAKK